MKRSAKYLQYLASPQGKDPIVPERFFHRSLLLCGWCVFVLARWALLCFYVCFHWRCSASQWRVLRYLGQAMLSSLAHAWKVLKLTWLTSTFSKKKLSFILMALSQKSFCGSCPYSSTFSCFSFSGFASVVVFLLNMQAADLCMCVVFNFFLLT